MDFFNERLKNSHSFIYNDEAYILKSYNKQDLHKKLDFLLNYPKNLEIFKRRIEKTLNLFLYFENDHSPKKEICFDLINYTNVLMSIREMECIKSYLCDNDIMLEWGAGGSTSYFSKFVKKYYSIKHDEKWFNIVKNQINSNVAFYLVKQNLPRIEPTKREEFKDYIEFIHKINVPVFNMVLIDGRARLFCAIEVLPFLNSDSIVFIHDFYPRKIYYPVLEYYEKIYEIKEKQGLVVLKKRT